MPQDDGFIEDDGFVEDGEAPSYRAGYPQKGIQPMPQNPYENFNRETREAWTQPSGQLRQGLSQMFNRGGSIPDAIAGTIAGAGNVGLGVGKTLLAPISTVLSATRNNSPLGYIQKPIEALLGGAGEFVGGHSRNATYDMARGVGVSDQAAQEVAEPVNEAMNFGTQALLTGGVAKGAPKVAGQLARETVGASHMRNNAKYVKEFERANPAKAGELKFKENLREAGNNLEYEIKQQGFRPKTDRQLAMTARKSGSRLWDSLKDAVKNNQDLTVDNKIVADKIRASVDDVMKTEFPQKAQAVLDYADRTEANGIMPIQKSWDTVQDINAELYGFYGKSGKKQVNVLEKDPLTEARKMKADLLRDEMASRLEGRGVEGIPELRKKYGAITSVEDYASRNIVASERPRPPMFSQGWKSTPLWMGMAGTGVPFAFGLPAEMSIPMGVGLGALSEFGKLRSAKNPTVKRSMKALGRSGQRPPDLARSSPPSSPPPFSPSPVAPLDEAPESMGGNMAVRGRANQAQIDKYYLEGKLTEEQAIQYGVSPELLRK